MTALLLALAISAPTEVEIHYMPPGTALELQLGGKKTRVQYFLFEEYKLLLKLDQELWDANKRLDIYKDLDLKYGGIIKEKDKIIGTLRTERDTQLARAERMEKNWHAAEKLAVENAGGPVWPYIVGAAGAVVGVVGVTLYLSEKLR